MDTLEQMIDSAVQERFPTGQEFHGEHPGGTDILSMVDSQSEIIGRALRFGPEDVRGFREQTKRNGGNLRGKSNRQVRRIMAEQELFPEGIAGSNPNPKEVMRRLYGGDPHGVPERLALAVSDVAEKTGAADFVRGLRSGGIVSPARGVSGVSASALRVFGSEEEAAKFDRVARDLSNRHDPGRGFGGLAGQALGSAIPTAAAIFGSGGGAAPAMLYYGITSYGNAGQDYRETMKSRGLDPKLQDEIVHGTGSAMIEIVSERLGLEVLGKIGRRGASKLGDKILKREYAKAAAQIALSSGEGAATEAIEEVVSQVANNALVRYGVPGLAAPSNPSQKLTEGVGASAGGGAFVGALFGGGASISNEIKQSRGGGNTSAEPNATAPSPSATDALQRVADSIGAGKKPSREDIDLVAGLDPGESDQGKGAADDTVNGAVDNTPKTRVKGAVGRTVEPVEVIPADEVVIGEDGTASRKSQVEPKSDEEISQQVGQFFSANKTTGKIVDPETDQQKRIQTEAAERGVQVLFVRGDGELGRPGASPSAGLILVDADLSPGRQTDAVAWHEMVHEVDRRDPEAWATLHNDLSELSPELMAEARRRYQAGWKAQTGEDISGEILDSEGPSVAAEIVIDFIMAEDQSPGTLGRMLAQNPGLKERIIDIFQAMLRKVGLNAGIEKLERARQTKEDVAAALLIREAVGSLKGYSPGTAEAAGSATTASPKQDQPGQTDIPVQNQGQSSLDPDGQATAVAEVAPPQIEETPPRSAKGPRISEAPPPPSTLPASGRSATIRVPGKNKPLNATYKIVEAEDLIPSHDATDGFKPNAYGDLNERPYNDPTAGKNLRQKVRAMADDIQPDFLVSDTPTPVDGPPIVNSDLVVLGGNARTMAIQSAYSNRRGDGLRDATVEAAGRFGVDGAEGFTNPVLVRVVNDADAGQPGQLSRELNQTFTAARSPDADAVSRGSKIDIDAARRISSVIGERNLGEVFGSERRTGKLIRVLLDAGAFTESDIEGMVDDRGLFTLAGRRVVENAMLGAAIGDVRRLAETSPSIRGALIRSLPSLMSLNNTGIDGADFSEIFLHAIDAVNGFKKSDAPTFESFKDQSSIFPQSWRGDVRAQEMAKRMIEDSSVSFAKRLASLAESGRDENSGQERMFGAPADSFNDVMGSDIRFALRRGEHDDSVRKELGYADTKGIALRIESAFINLGYTTSTSNRSEGLSQYITVLGENEDESVEIRVSDHAPGRGFTSDHDIRVIGEADSAHESEINRVVKEVRAELGPPPPNTGDDQGVFGQRMFRSQTGKQNALFGSQEQSETPLERELREKQDAKDKEIGDDADQTMLFALAPQVNSHKFRKWFGDSKVVDADGKPQVIYHGSRRPDRIGTRFRASRATSGPMAFFTDDPTIASNYSTSKQDTSIEMPEDFAGWFGYKAPRARSFNRDVTSMWNDLSVEERSVISDRFDRVTITDPDSGNLLDRPIILPKGETAVAGQGHWDFVMKREARGNPIRAMVEVWLNSGTIFGEEQQFMRVLDLAGVPMKNVQYQSPFIENPGVFPVYASIKNPFDTSDIGADVVNSLRAASKRKRGIDLRSATDPWDKRARSGAAWMQALDEDIETGSTHSWTSIPDWVTNTLKSLGYDGIKDSGGKNGGIGHTVWVPFADPQVKSATGNSGAFDAGNPDIRFALRMEDRAGFEKEIAGLRQKKASSTRIIREYVKNKTAFITKRWQGDDGKPNAFASLVSKETGPAREKYPWRVTEFVMRDGEKWDPRGHTVWESKNKAVKEAASGVEPDDLLPIRFALAFHGTPHVFEQFRTESIGTGEGAQAYGWGLYFASNKNVANWYRTTHAHRNLDAQKILDDAGIGSAKTATGHKAWIPSAMSQLIQLSMDGSRTDKQVVATLLNANRSLRSIDKADLESVVSTIRSKQRGSLFKVELAPSEDEYLLWEELMTDQSERVKNAIGVTQRDFEGDRTVGREFYNDKATEGFNKNGSGANHARYASESLHKLGIRGIKFLDGTSRNRPYREVKKAFRQALPDDADFSDILDLLGTGHFTAEQERVIHALKEDDWLGFDYPSQAISSAYTELDGFDASDELREAVKASLTDPSYNYVIFNDSDVKIKEVNGKAKQGGDTRFALRDDGQQDLPNARAAESFIEQGRPDLANPGNTEPNRRLVNTVDELRNAAGQPVRKDDEVVERRADEMMALGKGIETKIRDKVDRGEILDDVETVVAQRLVNQRAAEAIRKGDKAAYREALITIDAYRRSGTIAARAFRQRRDKQKGPKERYREALMGAFLEPDSGVREKLHDIREKLMDPNLSERNRKKAKQQQELLFDREADRISKIKKDLGKAGIDVRLINEESMLDPILASKVVDTAQRTRGSKVDALYWVWMNSILSGPLTHAANILGNAANIAFRFSALKGIEAVQGSVAKRAGGDPDFTLGDWVHMWKSLGPAVSAGFSNMARSYATNRQVFDEQITGEPLPLNVIKGEKVQLPTSGPRSKVLRVAGLGGFPLKLLMAEDQLFKTAAGVMEAHALAHRQAVREGLTGEARNERITELLAPKPELYGESLDSDIWRQSLEEARVAVFQDEPSVIGKTALDLRQGALGPILKWIVPFVRTPDRLFVRGIEVSPLGLIPAAAQAAKIVPVIGSAVPSSIAQEGAVAKDIARAVVVLGLLAAVYAWKDDEDGFPMITGSRSQTFRDLPEQYRTAPPLSIRFGSKWYSYARIEPLSTGLALTVDLFDRAEQGKDMGELVTGSGETLIALTQDKTFVRSIGQIMEALSNPDRSSEILTTQARRTFVTAWVPNLFKQTVRAFNPEIVDTKPPSDGGFWEKQAAKIPYEALPSRKLAPVPRYDIWGRPIKRSDPFGGGAAGIMWRLGVPINVSDVNLHPMDLLIWNYNEKVARGEIDRALDVDGADKAGEIHPRPPSRYFTRNGQRINMTADEYQELIRSVGVASSDRLLGMGLNVDDPGPGDVRRIKAVFKREYTRGRNRIYQARRSANE